MHSHQKKSKRESEGAGAASAQDCTIAAYADPAGSQSWQWLYWPGWGQETASLSFFVVMSTEDNAAAAAYKLDIPDLSTEVFLQNRIVGPSGTGLILDESPSSIGTNVALAECVIGFGGAPILVEEYVILYLLSWNGGIITIGPNTNQNPLVPEYVTCNDVQKDCMPGPGLHLYWNVVQGQSKSFGSIKSLYR